MSEQSVFERQIRADERARCAQLVREFGGLSAREAARHRTPKRGLIFSYVPAYSETVARLHDAVVFACSRLSDCILLGLEPLPDPSRVAEKIDWTPPSYNSEGVPEALNKYEREARRETGGTTGGAARKADKSPAGPTVVGDAPPSPAREQGTVGNLDGPKHWYPCKHCTDPHDCGSWATCMGNGEHWT
jgi:hypothetical protein